MGIAGTEIAKEASDIILLDDNFASLVKALVWGRCVYDAIRKFLQFQLTVNVSAVVITMVTAFVTTISGNGTPEGVLAAVQLLWVNLIMDTLAALALASDNPTDALLLRKPSKRIDPIINEDMARMIIVQAVYQIVVCLILYFGGPTWFSYYYDNHTRIGTHGVDKFTATVVFNTFIFCQIFNEINSRSISRGKF
jgi:Ca2+-transporting ATPase